ncbi:MAG: DUF488 domain-containing protein [Acidobacteriaceae bacterium]|nr:DUF488 domain-containing protein [Acidobacteriaceae bacterium]
MAITVKRVYDTPSRADGTRVLVDRLWPRGLSKASARLDAWLKDVAPSDQLRRWFHSHTDQWTEFRSRYLEELSSPDAQPALEQLYELAARGRLTLLVASKNTDRNNATVLKELLEGTRKPPVSTGPERRAAVARRQRRRPL